MSGLTPVLTQARNGLETPGVINALDLSARPVPGPFSDPQAGAPSGKHLHWEEGAAGRPGALRTGWWAVMTTCVDVRGA